MCWPAVWGKGKPLQEVGPEWSSCEHPLFRDVMSHTKMVKAWLWPPGNWRARECPVTLSHSPVTVGPSYGGQCHNTEPYRDAPSHFTPSRCQLIISHINGRHEKDPQEVLTLFIISSYISEKIPSWKLTWKPQPVSAPGSTGLFLGPQPPPMWYRASHSSLQLWAGSCIHSLHLGQIQSSQGDFRVGGGGVVVFHLLVCSGF